MIILCSPDDLYPALFNWVRNTLTAEQTSDQVTPWPVLRCTVRSLKRHLNPEQCCGSIVTILNEMESYHELE